MTVFINKVTEKSEDSIFTWFQACCGMLENLYFNEYCFKKGFEVEEVKVLEVDV